MASKRASLVSSGYPYRNRFRASAVPAEIGRILRDQDDFADAARGQVLSFAQDGGGRARAVGALDRGDGAEGALVGAAFRDLHIGPAPRCRKHPRRSVPVEECPLAGPVALAPDHGGDLVEVADPDPGVHTGVAAAELGPRPLGIAAGHDDLASAPPFAFQGRGDGLLGFYARRPDETAGVEDDDVGLLGIGGEAEAVRRQVAQHDFAVDQVLGAAEGDQAYGGALHSRRYPGPQG
jgi:hypothetical protein